MLNSNIVLGTETGKEIIHGSQIYLQYKSHDEPGIGFNFISLLAEQDKHRLKILFCLLSKGTQGRCYFRKQLI